MPIPIQREGEDITQAFYGCMEPCCFCEKPTPYWNKAADVAVCLDCAGVHDVCELPTKRAWCEAVRNKLLIPYHRTSASPGRIGRAVKAKRNSALTGRESEGKTS